MCVCVFSISSINRYSRTQVLVNGVPLTAISSPFTESWRWTLAIAVFRRQARVALRICTWAALLLCPGRAFSQVARCGLSGFLFKDLSTVSRSEPMSARATPWLGFKFQSFVGSLGDDLFTSLVSWLIPSVYIVSLSRRSNDFSFFRLSNSGLIFNAFSQQT